MQHLLFYERLEYFAKNYPTKYDILKMIEESCITINRNNKILKEELLKLHISPTNFLGIGLTMAPLRQQESGCILFVTIHTARPTNRLNLKHIDQLSEVYCLARYAQNMPHIGFREFFEKYFPPPKNKEHSLLNRLKLSTLKKENTKEAEWKKLEIDPTTLKYDKNCEIQDIITQENLGDLSLQDIESELGNYLNEGRWDHFGLFRSNNVNFVLSVTKFNSYCFGFTTEKPTNYLKLKQYSLLSSICNLIACFENLLKTHPHIYQAITEYQNLQTQYPNKSNIS